MAFNGKPIEQCSDQFRIEISQVYMVYVPGSGANICGHVLLMFQGVVQNLYGNHYFHIPGLAGY